MLRRMNSASMRNRIACGASVIEVERICADKVVAQRNVGRAKVWMRPAHQMVLCIYASACTVIEPLSRLILPGRLASEYASGLIQKIEGFTDFTLFFPAR